MYHGMPSHNKTYVVSGAKHEVPQASYTLCIKILVKQNIVGDIIIIIKQSFGWRFYIFESVILNWDRIFSS